MIVPTMSSRPRGDESSRLDRPVAEEKLDLFERSDRKVTTSCARAPQDVRRELVNRGLSRGRSADFPPGGKGRHCAVAHYRSPSGGPVGPSVYKADGLMNLALFDFDGTITRGDSWKPFLRAAVGPGRKAFAYAALCTVGVGYYLGPVRGSTARPPFAQVAFRGTAVRLMVG